MAKVKVPISDEVLRIWLAEQIEGYVASVNTSTAPPRNAREDWLSFAAWLRKRNESRSH